MSQYEMYEQLKKRLLSLLWRAGVMGALASLAVIVEGLSSLDLPNWAVVVVGLVCGEISKWLNSNKKRFGSALRFK